MFLRLKSAYNLLTVLVAAVAMAISSCDSSTDPLVDPLPIDGETTYMTIRLLDANTSSRAGVSYENGMADEHRINDARFFFFDENGSYLLEAGIWNGGEDNGDHGSTGNNVEFKGNCVVVLKGMTREYYPRYMLTVINAPTFRPESTLPLTAQSLAAQSINTIGNADGDKDYFVMSTSSYYGTNINHDNKYYYANLLSEANFHRQPEQDANGNFVIPEGVSVVDIYVERLAAKYQVDMTALANDKLQIDGRTLYKINASIAGSINVDGNGTTAGTDVYVELLGWDVNATANKTHLAKQLLPKWQTTDPFDNWNSNDKYRCYWCASALYDKAYDDADYNYANWNSLSKKINATAADPTEVRYAYSNENTAMPSLIADTDNKLLNTRVTSVVVKARVCDDQGRGMDMVRHNGLLFTKTAYLQYLLNSINLGAGLLDVWYRDGDRYRQIDASYLTLAKTDNGGTAEVRAVPAYTASTLPETTYYKRAYVNDQYIYTPYTDGAAMLAALTELIDNGQRQWDAEAFTGGAMYYNIPIRHMVELPASGQPLLEGNYGVVRNHWYKIEISKLSNIGHGIFDPEEQIIPDDPEPEYYYLAAQINILSWKIVDQIIDL